MNKNQKKFTYADFKIGGEIYKIVEGRKLGSLTIVGGLIAPSVFFVIILFAFSSQPKDTFNFLYWTINMQREIFFISIIYALILLGIFISYQINKHKKTYFALSEFGISVLRGKQVELVRWNQLNGKIITRKSFFSGDRKTLILKTNIRSQTNKHKKVVSMNDIEDYQEVESLCRQHIKNK